MSSSNKEDSSPQRESQKEEIDGNDNFYEGTWCNLPDNLLLSIFSSLQAKDLLHVSSVCMRWNAIAQSNTLWNKLFIRDFFKGKRGSRVPESCRDRTQNWKRRYLKNIYTTPCINVEVLEAHTDEVLHVSFSNDGRYFVTCSKDCKAIIWRTKDLKIDEIHDMVPYHWAFTWASQFSPSDKRLLISGVINEIGGELVVMERRTSDPASPFILLCRVINDPFDVNGCWWSDQYFISGTIISGLHDQFQASIWLCEPPDLNEFLDGDQEEEEDRVQLESLISINCYKYCLFKYQSPHVSYLRNILSTVLREFKCLLPPSSHSNETLNVQEFVDASILRLLQNEEEDSHFLAFMCSDMTSIPHKIGLYRLCSQRFSFTPVISSPDASLDLHGHTVGLCLSKDKRYLYVNVRSWPENSFLSNQELPAISSEIETKVIDMSSFTLVNDLVFTGHRAFTSSDSAFYLYLDTSPSFLTSGSENGKGFIWERGTGVKLSELDHEACVNSVVFHPQDEELCISVSDDKRIKVWNSLNRYKSSRVFDEAQLEVFLSEALDHKF